MVEVSLTLSPSHRYDTIDVRKRLASEADDLLQRHRMALYCSLHTTAGYLDHSLTSRLLKQGDRLSHFFGAFRTLFPQGAPYRHDELHLRTELSAEQREVEPRNGDSHLTFIGAGMRNCVTYPNRSEAPVYFIDLDGVNEGARRLRTTTVLGYDQEEVVLRESFEVPVSRHPVDSINLADERTGLAERIDELLARVGLEKGRVDIALEPHERNAGLTVNEFETLLMQHDLPEVLRNPLKFAALESRHVLDDPMAVPRKTINYAKYDLVLVFNSLMEAFRVDESVVERLLAKLIAVPARRFLRLKRHVSFLASDRGGEGRARMVRGTYQSPILVQWGRAEGQVRKLSLSLVRFR